MPCMTSRRAGSRASRAALAAAATSLALTSLTGCSSSSRHPTGGADGTILPTPSSRPLPPGRVLQTALTGMRSARVLAVDEDLQTGSREVEVRLTVAGHGSVVDATTEPIGFGSGRAHPGECRLQNPAGRHRPG